MTHRRSRQPISRRRLLGAGLGGVALAAGLAAPAVRAQAAKVTLQLNWIKSVQQGGHFVAIENGYFRDEGIECDVIQGGPGVDSIGLVASGRAMIGDRDSSNVLLARAKGIPIKGFAVTYQQSPFSMFSLKSKPVRGLDDMVGKTLAIPTQRRGPLIAILKRKGIDPAKVTFVPTGGDAGVLASGQVDAYFGWATNEALALQMRGVDLHVVSVDSLGDPTYPQVMFATDETLAKQRDLLARWLRAAIKGWRWMAEHPDETAKLVVEKYGRSGLDLAQQIAEARLYPDYILGDRKVPVMWIDAPMFEAGRALARDAGIAGDPPLDQLFTQDLLRQAHGMS